MQNEQLCEHVKAATSLIEPNHQTKHPLVISAEPGEKWMWCYQDEVFADYQ